MIKKGFHKNIKKAAAWTLTAVMAASLAGCGGGKADTPAVSETEKIRLYPLQKKGTAQPQKVPSREKANMRIR